MNELQDQGNAGGASDERTNAGKQERLPTGRNEDVEFSGALADEADLQALRRAEKADAHAESRADGR